MIATKETLTEMVRRFGKKMIDEADRFVGDDIKIYGIKISFDASVTDEVPSVVVTKIYNAPEIYVSLPERFGE